MYQSAEAVITGVVLAALVACNVEGGADVAQRRVGDLGQGQHESLARNPSSSARRAENGSAALISRGERPGAQLLALAREVGAGRGSLALRGPSEAELARSDVDSAAADAGLEQPSSEAASAADAGIADVGVADAAPSDAGSVPPLPLPLPPAPLPRDIVAQSSLPIYGLEGGRRLSEVELWDRIAQSPATCFGEAHDNPFHHYAETRALDELARRAQVRAQPLAVGFEMFQLPFQPALSAFVSGQTGEEQFLLESEYVARWGYDFALYRPLLEGVRERGLPALALNARAELTRKIGRGGLAALDAAELAELPELDLENAEHRAFIFGLFGVLPEHAAEFGLENVYVAQTTWDETMADTSAKWLSQAGADARLLIFAGVVHCHESAIPGRITRRTGLPVLSIGPIFESELPEENFVADGYDVLVVLQD